MVIYLSLQAQRMLLLEIIFSVLCCLLANSTVVRWLSYVVLAAALDIIYTEAAVGTGFCRILATQSRSISIHGS